MVDDVKQISWLPTVEEFETMITNDGRVSKLVNLTIMPNHLIQISINPSTNALNTFLRHQVGVILGRYGEFREFILKMVRSSYTFDAFVLRSYHLSNDEKVSDQNFVGLAYRESTGRLQQINYIRPQGDWFTDDLLVDLKRLTKNVPDDKINTVKLSDVLSSALSRDTPIVSNSIPLARLTDISVITGKPESGLVTGLPQDNDDLISDESVLKPSDFTIGEHFKYTETDTICRVTDVGTRTVTYIRLDQDDPRNYNGPPYSIIEHVLDEYDIATVEKVTLDDTHKD